MAITLKKVEAYLKKNPYAVASYGVATVGTVGSLALAIVSDVEKKSLSATTYPLLLLGVWAVKGQGILHAINRHSDE